MVRSAILIGMVGQVAVLGGLTAVAALGPLGWLAGGVIGAVTVGLLTRALSRAGAHRLGPANSVTLVRAVLVGGIAALVADGHPPSPTLITLATCALALDAVDGRVARRTGTVSAIGARFDMEVDALLILLLCVVVAGRIGAWMLTIGTARYLFVVAGRLWPWLRRPTPPRYWCKTVAAVQGIVLTVTATGAVPLPANTVLVGGALALLAESFGRQVWWLARHRATAAAAPREAVSVA